MAETKQEILETALKLEQDGHAFYMDAADAAGNELARRMYQSLAADEEKHMEWIRALTSGQMPDMTRISDTYERLRGIFMDAPESLRNEVKIAVGDQTSLKIGMDMEDKSAAAYQKWADETSDAELKALLANLVQFERGHRKILENTLQYLDKTGDWFMLEEQWNFEGGAWA